ncbi:MAG: glycoside hydrolase domain-containing protein [Promethearchaeota archaeon]
MEKNGKKTIYLLLAASTALMLVNLLMHRAFQQIGNNFDNSRYYIVLLLLPSLILLLASMIMQKFMDISMLKIAFLIYEACTIVIYAYAALSFELWNADNVLYIGGYMLVFNGVIYALMFAGAPSLVYFGILEKIQDIKAGKIKNDLVLTSILNEAAISAGIILIVLLLAWYVSLGFSYMMLAVIIGVAWVVDQSHVLDSRLMVSLKAESKPGGIERGINEQGHSKLKNTLMSFSALFLGIFIGFLWMINLMFFNSSLYPLPLNTRLLIPETINSLLVFEAIILLLNFFGKRLIAKIEQAKNKEMIFATMVVILSATMYLLIHVGTMVFPFRVSELFIPWILVMGTCWVITFGVERLKKSPGAIGSVMLSLLFGLYLGLSITSSPDEDYIPISLIVALAIGASFILISLAITTKKFLRNQDKIAILMNKINNKKRVNKKKLMIDKKKALVPLMIAFMALPVPAMFLSSVNGHASFQLLANVQNYSVFYLASPMTRIDQDYNPGFGFASNSNVNSTVYISAAKGESESFQVVMKPINQKHFSIYSLTFSGFKNEKTNETISADNFKAYRVRYIEALSNLVPDMLEEFYPFVVSDGKNHPLWLTFHVPYNTSAGHYVGNVVLMVDNKTNPFDWNSNPIPVNITVNLKVYNFSLPRIPTLKSNFGISQGNEDDILSEFQSHRMMRWISSLPMPKCTLYQNGSINTMDYNETDAIINKYHAFGTHSFGIYLYPTAVYLEKILPPGMFIVNGVNYTAANYSVSQNFNVTMAEYFNLFETRMKSIKYTDDFGDVHSWFDELFINGHDEIDAKGDDVINDALSDYEWLKNGVNCTIPIMQTGGDGMGKRQDIQDKVDIWCFHTGGSEPNYLSRWKSQGKEAWIYTTCGPRFPSPTLSTAVLATQARAIGWQTFIYNYTHYLIWSVNTVYNARLGDAYQGWSGGRIMYNVPGGFAITTRMELIRDGFEDHDYFVLLNRSLEALVNSNPNDARIPVGNNLLRSVDALMDGYSPTMDYRSFYSLRNQIGSFLEEISIIP